MTFEVWLAPWYCEEGCVRVLGVDARVDTCENTRENTCQNTCQNIHKIMKNSPVQVNTL